MWTGYVDSAGDGLLTVLSVVQLSGCVVCGLGVWTVLEKGVFLRLMTVATYEVRKVTFVAYNFRASYKKSKSPAELKSVGIF